jgi:hypothetical protein
MARLSILSSGYTYPHMTSGQRDICLAKDAAGKAADTVLVTVPNQLEVECNARLLELIVKYVATLLGWSD